jgi:hypothetical protein
MDQLPSPHGNLTQEEREKLREAFDEWLIETDGVTPHVAS